VQPDEVADAQVAPVVLQPTSGRPGPPSGTPTLCAPPPGCPVISSPTPMPSRATSSPSPIDHATTRSAIRCRTTTTASTAVASQISATAERMTEKSRASKGVSSLKWLRTPRAA